MSDSLQRLAKVIAGRGVCSRRKAESLIENGHVKVDGKVILNVATCVDPHITLHIRNKLIPIPESPRLWVYHKPTGLICTHADELGRPTIFDAIQSLKANTPHLISVGRLDLNSEGLLLLTNTPSLAHQLEHPSFGWQRRYRVRFYGQLTESHIHKMEKGLFINGVKYAPIKVKQESAESNNKWVELVLSEGKNREIRNIFEHFNLKISRLCRISYGPFQLGRLPKGALKEVSQKVLSEQLSL